ncbi:MFS transporter [Burkholderia arboris]|uniref:MFS transporter n=1 Tax=Burkholderia arboris TaxID=488730 RepID=UPI0030F2A22F
MDGSSSVRTLTMKTSKLAIASLFLTIFVDAAGIGIVFPALTPMLLNNETGLFAASVSEATRYQIYGIVLALYPLAMFAASPLLGDMSDRYGRKRVLLLCLGGNALGMLGTAAGVYAGSLWWVLIGRAICGLTAASLPVAQAAVIDISAPDRKAGNLSMITAANGVGFAIGPVIGGAFSGAGGGAFGLALPFVIGAALAALTLAFVTAFFSDRRVRDGVARARRTGAWRRILANAASPALRPPLIILAVFLTGYYIFFNYMSAFSLLRYGFDAFWEAMLLSFYSACFAVSLMFIIPALAKAFSPKQNLMGSLMAQPVLIALVVMVDAPASLWATVPLLALAVSNSYVTLLSIASNRAAADDQGQVLGVVSSINALAWGVAPIVTSLLQPHSIVLPVAASALVLVAACALGGRFCNQAVELEVSR